MKSGKEIKIKSPNNDFKIFAGAIAEYKHPKTIYLNISSWVKLKRDVVNIDSIVRNLKCNLKMELFNSIDERVFNKYDTIFDMEVSTLGLKNGKFAFLNLEINLTQNGRINMFPLIKMKTDPKPDLVPYLNKIIESIVNSEAITDNQHLKFSKTKKKINKHLTS